MNSLGRDIRVGEVVIVRKSVFAEGVRVAPRCRTFVCTGGAGLVASAPDQTIDGYWYVRPGSIDVIDGDTIDPKETERFSPELAVMQEGDCGAVDFRPVRAGRSNLPIQPVSNR